VDVPCLWVFRGCGPVSRRVLLSARTRSIPPTQPSNRTTEAIHAGAFNALVRLGAGLLVNLTDDGWFASDKAAAQHLELTRLRAVETRRWLVRASNSGISAFIDPTGRVAAALPFGAIGVLRHRIEVGGPTPRYVRWGDWVLVLCAALTLARLIEGFHRRGGRTRGYSG